MLFSLSVDEVLSIDVTQAGRVTGLQMDRVRPSRDKACWLLWPCGTGR